MQKTITICFLLLSINIEYVSASSDDGRALGEVIAMIASFVMNEDLPLWLRIVIMTIVVVGCCALCIYS